MTLSYEDLSPSLHYLLSHPFFVLVYPLVLSAKMLLFLFVHAHSLGWYLYNAFFVVAALPLVLNLEQLLAWIVAPILILLLLRMAIVLLLFVGQCPHSFQVFLFLMYKFLFLQLPLPLLYLLIFFINQTIIVKHYFAILISSLSIKAKVKKWIFLLYLFFLMQ